MHTVQDFRPVALDRGRIASISGAIAINGLLLLLLVAPMSAPVMRLVQDRDPQVVFVDRKPRNPLPPPKDPPIRVDIRHETTPRPTPISVPPQPDLQPVVISDPMPGDLPAAATDDGPTMTSTGDGIAADPGPPMTGAHLDYARNPAPTYPRKSLADGDEGTVLLEVTVDVDGRPIAVSVSRSSGHRELDLAARRQVLSSWLFRPAMRDGRAVQAIGLVPVEFKLN